MAMASLNAVIVTEKCRIKQAPNSESEKISETVATNYIPLTFFDTLWLRFPPTQRIFFYEIDQLSSDFFYNTIIPNLKNSLSLTLQHYPSLAGAVTWHPQTGKPVIRHAPDDDGVFFSVAESCANFDSLSTHDLKEAKDLHALLPEFHVSETEATVLSVLVTLFPSQGFSIAYCSHHVSMDGKSNAMFLKSWSTICRDGGAGAHPPEGPELMPVLERSLIADPLDLSKIYVDHWMKTTQNKRSLIPMDKKPETGLFRRTFRLTPGEIGQIKGKIKFPVSSYTAVCAYVWRCLVKAEEGDITKETVYLNINVDCRSRLEPPIPANYFGNCVTYLFAKEKVASLVGDDGLVLAATAVKEAIGRLEKGVVKGAEKWLSEVSSTFRNEKVCGIAASTRFDLYGSDFGWGRPRMAELVSIDRNSSFSLCDGRDGNDVNIEIGIVLKKVQLEAFASLFAQGLQPYE
ncbi:phenolic glucoside malonyltransferase 1-like [Impatiens glandulifera]|uniref:phenolic glucoside malonyltransferase 1-like n=1 Tax=Impatiens glandulifera TaxID=253017 RepID=UPI001FB14D3F|nr:phenolic glucoside malonyltransferase 1-like [Impatiens glandulifera]